MGTGAWFFGAFVHSGGRGANASKNIGAVFCRGCFVAPLHSCCTHLVSFPLQCSEEGAPC